MKKIITTDKAPAAIGPYSQAVDCGSFLVTSGQVPFDPATGEFVPGGIAEQTRQVLANIREVLAAAGLTMDNVVKTTVFLQNMGDGKVFAFYGKMGAGKTTFVKAICEELGVEDVITSPTFALVNEYTAGDGSPVYHFDFYRIKKLEEVYDMGYEDYFYSGNLCFLEWPELIEELLPEDCTKVTITVEEDGTRSVEW